MSIDGESSAGEKNSNAGKSRVVVLSAARTKIERDLLDRWCRSDDVPADYRASGSLTSWTSTHVSSRPHSPTEPTIRSSCPSESCGSPPNATGLAAHVSRMCSH